MTINSNLFPTEVIPVSCYLQFIEMPGSCERRTASYSALGFNASLSTSLLYEQNFIVLTFSTSMVTSWNYNYATFLFQQS